jgi:hypothetical protein
MPQPRRYADQAARQRAYRARQEQARLADQQAKGLPPAPALSTLPSRGRWQALLTHAHQALETARDEMQAYADERSDAWQQSARAEALADQIEALSMLLDDLQTLSVG